MRRSIMGVAVVLAAFLLGGAACDSKSQTTGAKEEAKSSQAKLARVHPDVQFEKPVGLVWGADGRMFVTEQSGRIVYTDGSGSAAKSSVLLDIQDRVFSEGSEQGLLGLAFHPKFEENGYLYVNYTTKTHTVIARYSVPKGENGRTAADPSSEVALLTFAQPYANHNGGQLAFGPDGYLYIGTGDGGSGGDPHGNGQNKDTLLGKILRIDVDKPSGTEQRPHYGIPADNPFVSGGGASEIYAYGLRNPWRFSFDTATGDLWAADVGQDKLEEIDRIVNGGNYGWNVKEGTRCFKPEEGCESAGLIDPVWTYGRDLGQSVTGGFVYRGKALPGLAGWYVYGDYATGNIWALRQVPGKPTYENKLLLASGYNITSFGQDREGELYLCTADGEVYRFERA
ncbi:PQQ-dependent sugar dehydrogenase [Cohnella nanjingensis]|uniref:PQQ-dependent sugar dehydrogenase n=1 Tax=Cohnella nanjingensis TaxID=1387779 RepID=A0A7X0RVF9_9BACL|nr:PQQ-dependent sugar dehydrogenase [Cohnella nanjingensis]MBB6674353.1 PQQ-dependent sugar dehydrogenase [Cohnella nanjingensis]